MSKDKLIKESKFNCTFTVQHWICEIHGEMPGVGLQLEKKNSKEPYRFCLECWGGYLSKHIPQMTKGEMKEIEKRITGDE